MKNTNLIRKKKTTSVWKRALMMFCIVAVIAVVSIVAYDGSGLDEDDGLTYTYGDGYIGDVAYWDYYLEDEAQNNAPPYQYESYDWDNYYSYEETGDFYESSGYIGVAPEYINETLSYFYGTVAIEVDDDGAIEIYPPGLMSIAMFAYDYLFIRFNTNIYAGNIGFTLPYGWTHDVTHNVEERFAYIFEVFEYGRVSSGSYTFVRIRHTWNDPTDGFIGFQPFAINAPGHTARPAVNTQAALINAINNQGVGNCLIPISGPINITAFIVVPAGRHIIIASQGTNFQNNMNLAPTAPGTIHTLNRLAGPGRHFHVHANATLQLAHIILDGHRTAGQTQGRGGITVTGANSRLYVRAGTVIRNNRYLIGGGINALTGGTVNIIGGTIINNNSDGGGGVHTSNNMPATINMSGGIVENNYATNWGGGFQISPQSTFTMTGGTIRGNRTSGFGGGVNTNGTGAFAMSGTTALIENNVAATVGGGVVVEGGIAGTVFTMSGGTIQNNRAPNGGGVAVAGLNTSTFTMSGGTIRNNRFAAAAPSNTAISNGGGVWVSGATSVFTMTGGTIGDANQAQGNQAIRGGGVFVGNGATFNMLPGTGTPAFGTVRGNTGMIASDSVATTGGGGVWLTGTGSTFNMSAGHIRDNLAHLTGGGGVAIQGAPTGALTHFIMTGGEIFNNETTGTIPNSGGGGVRIHGTRGLFTMGTPGAPAGATTPAIHNNVVAHSGAGVALPIHMAEGLVASTFIMHSGTIHSNTAATGTGGVALGSSAIFYMHGGRIHNNQSTTGNAGGVGLGHGVIQAIDNNTYFTMYGGTIENNRANNGGGVNVAADVGRAYFTMYGGTIRNNRSNAANNPIDNGGGVRVYGPRATFNMHGGIIGDANATNAAAAGALGNRATRGGGVFVDNGAAFNMLPGTGTPPYGTVRGNIAVPVGNNSPTARGGGVHVGGASHFYMAAGQIRNNTAGHTTFETQGGGGGVWLTGVHSTFDMSGGQIRDNTSLSGGGGVAIDGDGDDSGGYVIFTMTGGEMFDNRTTGNNPGNGGGGVRVSGYSGRFIMGTSGASIDDDYPAIHNNISARAGGGVNVPLCVNRTRAGEFTLYSGVIRNNSAGTLGAVNVGARLGGGVGMGSSGIFHMYGGRILDNNAVDRGGGVSLAHGSAMVSTQPTTLNMHDGLIQGNRAPVGGGVCIEAVHASVFNMYAGIISNNRNRNMANNPILRGGGVHVNNPTNSVVNSIFNMYGGIIGDPNATNAAAAGAQGNRAYSGGGVFVGGGATFNMLAGPGIGSPAYGTIRGNLVVLDPTINHSARGGGVSVNSGASFNMSAGQIRNNTGGHTHITDNTGSGGGGVWIGGVHSTFDMSGGQIRYNTSLCGGGGVDVSGDGTGSGGHVIFTMTGGEILSNAATGIQPGNNGGGVRLAGYSSRFIMGTSGAPANAVIPAVRSNTSAGNGGGVSLTICVLRSRGGEFTLYSGLIDDNESSGAGGGGINLGSNSIMHMHGGTISNNRSITGEGGGIRVMHTLVFASDQITTLNMHGGVIENNRAPRGGGVSIAGIRNSVFNMHGGIIRNNRYTPTGGTIQSGGGVYLNNTPNSLLNSTFNMSGGIIEDNVAAHGGGVSVHNGASFNMTNGDIWRNRGANNDAPGVITSNGTGGGVFLTDNGTTFNFQGGSIFSNVAETLATGRGGGGVEAINDVFFLMGTDAVIRDNYAFNSGGGVNLTNGTIFDLNGGVINNNGTENAGTRGNGGGVAVNGATFFFQEGDIHDNVGRLGGGLFLYRSNASMHPGAVISNNAGSAGGGGVAVYSGFSAVDEPSHFTMLGGVISNNGQRNHPIANINAAGLPVPGIGPLTTTPHGGGVVTGRYLASFSMVGGTISQNTAQLTGGGIAVLEGSRIDIQPITGGLPISISNNIAAYGAGIAVSGIDNRATIGNASFRASEMTMSGGVINNNVASQSGGGIFIGNDTVVSGATTHRNQVQIDAGQITANTANAVGSATQNGGGGGIYVSLNGRLNVLTGNISNNLAPNGMGGGIFTENHGNYPDPLITTPVYPGAGPATHFQNLTLGADTVLTGNTASFVAIPPINVRTPSLPLTTLPNIQWNTGTPLSPPAAPENLHPLNNLDINFINETLDFAFIKTDNVANPYNGIRLQGAVFQLYWRSHSSAAWAISGPQVTSGPDGVVEFTLTAVGQYRLVEVIPPPTFAPTFGYWILETTTTGGVTTVTAVHSHGGNPLFRQHDYDGDEWWWVGNRPDFYLPLTGGIGISVFIATGGLVLSAAALTITALIFKKKLAAKPVPISNRYRRTS